MEKFLNTPLHYGIKSMIDIENMKCIVEQEIKKRHFESLHYVLFDETRRLPWAFHLYQKNGKFYVKGRDDAVAQGKTIRFSHDPRLDSFRGSALEWEWNYLREKYGYIDLDKIGGYWYASI